MREPSISEYEAERFRLRRLTKGDIANIYDNFSDTELMKFYDMAPFDNKEQAEDLFECWQANNLQGTGYRWCIAMKDANRLIGTIGFHCIDATSARAELGYEINRDFWGRGVMSEVLPYVLHHGFDVLELNRLSALIRPGNVASIALVRKFGFWQEGVLRSYTRISGVSTDVISFSLLSSEFIRPISSVTDERVELA